MKSKIFLLVLFVLMSANAFSQFRPPVNGNVNIASIGATDRTQFPDIRASSCSVQAPDTNAGAIYLGGSTVTNLSGTNAGIKLEAGDTISNITVTNVNQIYVAADIADDDAKYVCN